MFRLTYRRAIIRQYDTKGKIAHVLYTPYLVAVFFALRFKILYHKTMIYNKREIIGYKINVYKSNELKS
jgi:hypothetical protein